MSTSGVEGPHEICDTRAPCVRALLRAVVTVACAGALAFSGSPVLAGTVAAPKPATPLDPRRCDVKYGLVGKSPGKLPWDQGRTVRPEAEWDEYDFENPRKAMDGLDLPDDSGERLALLESIGTDYEKYKEGDPKRVYATYWNNQKHGKNKFKGTF